MNEPGTITTLPCPKCGELLIIRAVKQTHERFLACQRYPRCTYTDNLPAYFHVLEAGGKMLPGMEEL